MLYNPSLVLAAVTSVTTYPRVMYNSRDLKAERVVMLQIYDAESKAIKYAAPYSEKFRRHEQILKALVHEYMYPFSKETVIAQKITLQFAILCGIRDELKDCCAPCIEIMDPAYTALLERIINEMTRVINDYNHYNFFRTTLG